MGVGDVVVVAVGDVVVVVVVCVGDVVACVAENVLAGWVTVPVCADDALAVAFECLRAVAVADAEAEALAWVLVADEICAAGYWAGVAV